MRFQKPQPHQSPGSHVLRDHQLWQPCVTRKLLISMPYSDVEAAVLKYLENGHGPEHYRQALAQFSKDYYFVCPLIKVAAKVAEAGSPVYVYSFNHTTLSGFIWHEWMGAAHGAELPFLFGILSTVRGTNESVTKAEAELSRKVMRYWAEFARSG
uniref:Uncharacterized protein n=1 Tax=Sphaerodactylus townsendi TaxID=933632 RepID=A0ACB8EFV9_9SAUR